MLKNVFVFDDGRIMLRASVRNGLHGDLTAGPN